MHCVKKGKPALVLAPMEGVTDAPMRALLTSIGGFTHCVSEFLRISVNIPPEKIFYEHTPELRGGSATSSGVPVFFQLLGGDPEKLAESAAIAAKLGAAGIDLNFGCPAPTVNRHDGGATLLKYPERIFNIIKSVREGVPPNIPVSAKFRLGWDSHDPIYKNAEMAVLAGASWITIHGRTKVAGYKPPAYWGPIGELRQTLPIPVIANGDIWTIDDFKRCQDETGCEHFMLGRGAIANPHLPTAVAKALGLKVKSELSGLPNLNDWKHYYKDLIRLSDVQTNHPTYALCRVKQWAKATHLRAPFEFYEKVKILQKIEELTPLL